MYIVPITFSIGTPSGHPKGEGGKVPQKREGVKLDRGGGVNGKIASQAIFIFTLG